MKQTPHYEMNKPDESDYALIEILNANADITDTALHGLEERKPTAHLLTSRIRDPSRPGYGLGGVGDTRSATLEAGAYTGTAEVTLEIGGKEYDAVNLSTDGDSAPNGTIMIRKLEE